jgi:hypothetical protein
MQLTDDLGRAGRGWSYLARIIADVGHGLGRGLSGLASQRIGAALPHSRLLTPSAQYPGELFAQALRDDSNREMDWLWLYTQMPRVSERRYCLERALAINPRSEMARTELATLPPR